MKKNQKGYALLLTMAIATMSLSITLFEYKKDIIQDNELKQENIINQTAQDFTVFSNATKQLMEGVGAIPGETVEVSALKDTKLVSKGFNEKTAFNQKLKAYYITSPNNNNVIDVLISLTGEPEENVMKQYGISDNNLDLFYSKVIEKIEAIGFNVDFSGDFYIGRITNNGNSLYSNNGEVLDISNVKNDNSNSIGIYFEAPNQIGWWRFQFSPYLWQTNPTMSEVPSNSSSYLRGVLNASDYSSIVNSGFSYFCPSNFNKVGFGEELEINRVNLNDLPVSEKTISVCIETYKGSIVPDFEVPRFAQLFNPLSSSDPSPVNSRPSVWQRCFAKTINYSIYPVSIGYGCAEREDMITFVNPMNISGLDNNVVFNSYNAISNNSKLKNIYNMKNRDKTDFKVPNAIFSQGFIRKIDDRYLQTYQMVGSFLTAQQDKPFYDSSAHTINKISGVGIKISNKKPKSSASVTTSYRDKSDHNQKIKLTLPTPLIK